LPTLDPGVVPAVQATLALSFVDAITDTMRFGILFAVISGLAAVVLVPRRARTAQVVSLDEPFQPNAPIPNGSQTLAAGNGANGAGLRPLEPAAFATALHRPQKTAVRQ
jgi:hypothetical protein